MTKYISFDIGGTTIKYALVDNEGKMSQKADFSTKDNSKYLIENMTKVVKDFQTNDDVIGIGISAPGIVRKDGYMVTGGAISSFNNFPLAKTLSETTGLPVTVENDANAAAIAEQWLGNARGCDNYLTIVLGTGVGGGIVINGDVYRGQHGMAGEFGWNVVHDIDLTHNLEDFSLNQHSAVVGGLFNRYNASVKQVKPDEPSVFDAREILQKAEAGDHLAQQAVDEFVQDTIIMLLNLFANFDPELILIGGGISANDKFMSLLENRFEEYLQRHESLNRIKTVALGQIRPAKLRNEAGLIGAAYQIQRYLAKEKVNE